MANLNCDPKGARESRCCGSCALPVSGKFLRYLQNHAGINDRALFVYDYGTVDPRQPNDDLRVRIFEIK